MTTEAALVRESPELETTEYAITERGKKITHTQEEVDHALTLLAEAGGSQTLAAAQLKEEGFKTINSDKLRKWRDNCFPHRYLQLRRDASPQISEKIAGSLLERALEANEVEQEYLRVALEKVDQVPTEHLAKNVLALANAKSHSIEKAQLLRHEPTEIVETRSVDELTEVLTRAGVAEVIDAEVIGEEDAQ